MPSPKGAGRFYPAVALIAMFIWGCRKDFQYVSYRAPAGEFEAQIPKDWLPEGDAEGKVFRIWTWVGPADKKALWGAPRIVMTWNAFGRPYHNAAGEVEAYQSIQDYLEKVGGLVWGPVPKYPEPLHDVAVGGRNAKRLTVEAKKEAYMSLPGAKPVSQGGGLMWRKDSAILVPTRTGFYAIIFPTAKPTYDRYAPAFENFVKNLRFLKDEP